MGGAFSAAGLAVLERVIVSGKVVLGFSIGVCEGEDGRAGFAALEEGRDPEWQSLAGGGGQGGAAGTAEARAGGAALAAGAAEKVRGWGGLRGVGNRLLGWDCGLGFRLGGERPDEGDDPADERPARENVQQQNAREVPFVPRQKRGKEIEEQRDNPEKRVEREKGEDLQGKGRDGEFQHARVLSRFGAFGVADGLRTAKPILQRLKPLSLHLRRG